MYTLSTRVFETTQKPVLVVSEEANPPSRVPEANVSAHRPAPKQAANSPVYLAQQSNSGSKKDLKVLRV